MPHRQKICIPKTSAAEKTAPHANIIKEKVKREDIFE